MVYGDPELLPRGSQQITNFQTQQGSGGLLPFPEGKNPSVSTPIKCNYTRRLASKKVNFINAKSIVNFS